jgi:branched-chain amino acid transport system permease protein
VTLLSVTDLTTMALMISLVASLNLLAGRAKLIVFSHAAFYAVGAYTTGLMNRAGAGFAETIVVSAVLAAVAGVIVALPGLRTAGAYFAMTTWALAVIAQTLFHNLEFTGGPYGLPLQPATVLGQSLFDINTILVLAWATAIVTLVVVALISHSRLGWAIRALGEDERAAQSLGISRSNVVVAFALTAALVGVAGSVYAYFITYVYSDPFSIDLSILLLVCAIVGGLGSLTGSVLGTILILLIRNALRASPQFADILFGIALVAIIHLRPEGLFPARQEMALFRRLAGLFTARARRRPVAR